MKKMMQSASPSAKAVAYLRHLEVEVSGDTLAADFCDEEGRRLAERWLEWCPHLSRMVAIRGRSIEDAAEKYIRQRGIKRMLNAAAGLNTFVYRHPAAGALEAYAEIDLPAMIEFKKRRIEQLIEEGRIRRPKIELDFIPMDLSSPDFPDAFRKLAWHRPSPSICVLEGMSYYLPLATLERTIDAFRDATAPGSVFIMDYFPDFVRGDEGLTALLTHLPTAGAETCVTYLGARDVARLFPRFRILSDRLENEMELEFYSDSIGRPVGSVLVAESA